MVVGADVSGSTGADVGDKVVGGSCVDEVGGGMAVETSKIGLAATVHGFGAEDVGGWITVVGTWFYLKTWKLSSSFDKCNHR
jgi:hypothetical protein